MCRAKQHFISQMKSELDLGNMQSMIEQKSSLEEKFIGPTLSRPEILDDDAENIHWWFPGLNPWERPAKPSSSLKIAVIVSDNLFDGLRFEAELFAITPYNWQHILQSGLIDFLLVESTLESVTGHWRLAQLPISTEADALKSVIREFARAGIPTGYWITEDHTNHSHFNKFAQYFDRVFCADPREIPLLSVEGISAQKLQPCVQPALYNPVRKHSEYQALDLGVIFDGWDDLIRRPDRYNSVLSEIQLDHRLRIIESRRLLRVDSFLSGCRLNESILGCVSQETRRLALRYAKSAISFTDSLITQTTQQWEALQAVASYLPVVHFGALSSDDMRVGLVSVHEDELQGLVELIRIQEDEFFQKRLAHSAWRNVLQNHTFSHRLRDICNSLSVKYDGEEHPKASVIISSGNSESLKKGILQYRDQNYTNKELIVIADSDAEEVILQNSLPADAKLVHLQGVVGFSHAEESFARELVSGSYIFRFADYDYGENYLLDAMLWLRITDAVWLGKPTPPSRTTQTGDKVSVESQGSYLTVLDKSASSGRDDISRHTVGYRNEPNSKAHQIGECLNKLIDGSEDQLDDSLVIFCADRFNLIAPYSEDSTKDYCAPLYGMSEESTDLILEDKDFVL